MTEKNIYRNDIMKEIGKILIILGIIIFIIGIFLFFLQKLPFKLGKLPGDIHIKKGRTEFYLPITTCIIISCILSVILYIIFKIFKK